MKPAGSFNLLRWFAWLSPIAIGLIALINAWLISSFLNDHLFQREASVTRDFVQNILLSDGSLDYLSQPENLQLKPRFANSIEHLTNMRDVLRANVYGADRRVIWSTDPKLQGRLFSANDELDDALQGNLVVHAGAIGRSKEKSEHVGLDPSIKYFVESYIPVSRPDNGQVIAVVEIYKAPLALTEAIQEGRLQVAIAAIISALTLYLCLYWIIRRADRIIKQQRVQLLEAETMAVVGELTSSVAHNIRNPLSSIRSAAELIVAYPQENGGEQAADIIREADRISHRITELLRFSGNGAHHLETVDLVQLLIECSADHRQSFGGQDQNLRLETPGHSAHVLADRALLLQVFQSLLSNASEAMNGGGECVITVLDADSRHWQVSIADKGCGISAETAEKAFRPFYTTKPKGLGLGLPLARRIVERFGGSLTLTSEPGAGTTVRINLPKG